MSRGAEGEFAARSEAASPSPAPDLCPGVARDLHSEAGGAEPEAGEVDPRINSVPRALLPAELIQSGEIIILMIKPSPWYILLEPLRTLAVIALLTAVAASLARYDWLTLNPRDVVIAGIGLIGVRLFWQFLEWLSRLYILTDRRVIRVMGVLRVYVFETALKNIQHTECVFSVRERVFGLGSILFATAGTALPEAAWRMIAQPLEVHRRVVQAIQRYR